MSTVGELGATGLALMLDGATDQQPALLISGIGFVLQCMFIFYMLVYIFEQEHDRERAHVPLLFAAVYLNSIISTSSIMQGIKALGGLTEQISNQAFLGEQAARMVIVLDSMVIPGLMVVVGGLWLGTSSSIEDLVLNATAVAFVNDIDNAMGRIIDWALGSARKGDSRYCAWHGDLEKNAVFGYNQVGVTDSDNISLAVYAVLGMLPVAAVITAVSYFLV